MQVTIRSPCPRRARRLQEELQGAGVDAVAKLGPVRNGAVAEEIALLDAAPGDMEWAMATARDLRRSPVPPGAILALAPLRDARPEAAAGFDGWVQSDASAAMRVRDVADAHRGAIAQIEADARNGTARALGLSVNDSADVRPLRCLFIGDPHPLYLPLEHALADKGGLLEAAFSSFTAFDRLHEDAFDGVVINAGDDATTTLALCGALRRNKQLHHLPTTILTSSTDQAFDTSAVQRGAALILDQKCATDDSVAWILEKARGGRRKARADQELSRHAEPDSPMAPAFFRAHLARIADDAHRYGRLLTVVAFQVVPAPGARRARAPEWRRGLADTSGIVRRLVRVHDSVCLLENDTIAVALPQTGEVGARAAAKRVCAVAECAAFTAGEGAPGPILLGQSIAELAPGESGAGLLARVLDGFTRSGARA